MDNIHLIEATSEDISRLIDIEKDASKEKTYSAILTEEEWLQEFSKNKIFFIKRNKDVVGELCYEIRDNREVYLSGLVVLKQFRGLGIAKNVLRNLLGKYHNYNFSLVTHPENPAVILYQNLGFKASERVENYFGDGEPRLKLQLSREGSK